MDMYTAEEKYGVIFPRKFREIYQSGAMAWMENSQKDYREVYAKYKDVPSAFCYNLAADFHPYFFESMDMSDIEEYLSMTAEYDKKKLDERYRLVPFGKVKNGDIYCFLYDSESDDIKIVLVWHDGQCEVQLLGNDFDEFLYLVMLCAADWDEDIEGDVWKAHLGYLSPEYREKINGKTADELKEEFFGMPETMIDIFVDL